MNTSSTHPVIRRLGLATSLAAPVLAQDKPIKIGVTAGPHAQIFEVR